MEARATAAEADARLVARLRGGGLRVTPQRLALHRLLADRPRHVTAEALLREASTDLPGLALPTVYSTLELFAELGVVRRVAAPARPATTRTRRRTTTSPAPAAVR